MKEFNVDEFLLQNENVPLVECVYARSSNPSNETVYGYAITKVIKQPPMERLRVLKELVRMGVEGQVDIIKGFEYADTKNWTKVNEIVKNHKILNNTDLFEVIWLDKQYSEGCYHGYAGYDISIRRGIIVRYPDEMKNAS